MKVKDLPRMILKHINLGLAWSSAVLDDFTSRYLVQKCFFIECVNKIQSIALSTEYDRV